MPASAAPVSSFTPQERDTAAWYAVALVVLSAWLLRGLGSGQTWWTAPVAALAAASSLNWLSTQLRAWLNQVVVISGYVTIVVLAVVTFVAHISFDGQSWYSEFQSYFVDVADNVIGPDFLGASVIAPIIISIAPTWAIWLLKARFSDKNPFTFSGFIYSGVVTLIGATFVIGICIISDEVFARLHW